MRLGRNVVIIFSCILLIVLFYILCRPLHRMVPRPPQRIGDIEAMAIAASFEIPHAKIIIISRRGAFVNLKSERFDYSITNNTVSLANNKFFGGPRFFFGPNYRALCQGPQSVSESDASRIAWGFIQKHFVGCYRLNALSISKPGGQAVFQECGRLRLYTFYFYYNPGGLVMGPCYCDVSIESTTGKIVTYRSSNYPIAVSTRPSISVRTAITNSMPYLVKDGRNATLYGLWVSAPKPRARERLLYIVTFDGRGPTEFNLFSFAYGYDLDDPSLLLMAPLTRSQMANCYTASNHYVAAIDAHTGDFIGWDFYDWQHRSKILPWVSKAQTDKEGEKTPAPQESK